MKHTEELLLDDYYTIGCVFSDEPTARIYTYKVDNSIDIEVDDFVVVLASGEYKVIKVREVHEEADISLETNFSYKYIIDKIDFSTYRRLQERSEKIATILKESKRRQVKNELLENMKDNLDDAGVKALTVQCGNDFLSK